MDFKFTPEQDMLRKSVAEFLKKEAPFETVREIEDSEKGYSSKLWKKMANLEWMGICFPEVYGGFGDPFGSSTIILEEIGKRAFPSPFFSTAIECGTAILEGGTEKQKKELLKKISTGKLLMAFARYEENAEYDIDAISMKAESSGDSFILNGKKLFVNDANVAGKLLVAAVTVSGLSIFIVDTTTPGITVEKMPSIAHENSCEVAFKDVKVNAGDILGKEGTGAGIFAKIEPRLIIAKCAEMLGGCHTTIQLTADYAKNRVQYGFPIGANQAIQHYLADMSINYDLCINYFYKTVWAIEQEMDVARDVSAVKAMVNEAYNFIANRAIRIHGGVGLTREFDIGLFFQRAKAFELTLGDTDFHYERMAKAMGM